MNLSIQWCALPKFLSPSGIRTHDLWCKSNSILAVCNWDHNFHGSLIILSLHDSWYLMPSSGLHDECFHTYFWIKYDLGQKYYAPKVRPFQDSNSWPPDHDSTFHVTEKPALTTQPSVTTMHVVQGPRDLPVPPAWCVSLVHLGTPKNILFPVSVFVYYKKRGRRTQGWECFSGGWQSLHHMQVVGGSAMESRWVGVWPHMLIQAQQAYTGMKMYFMVVGWMTTYVNLVHMLLSLFWPYPPYPFPPAFCTPDSPYPVLSIGLHDERCHMRAPWGMSATQQKRDETYNWHKHCFGTEELPHRWLVDSNI